MHDLTIGREEALPERFVGQRWATATLLQCVDDFLRAFANLQDILTCQLADGRR